jgi:hypothetical protein
MSISWPHTLVDDIARRRCVLFLGAGVSMNAVSALGKRPPGWVDFLQTGLARVDGATKHIRALIKTGDLLTACELIKTKLDDQWLRLLDDEFVNPRYTHAKIHESILKLDSRIVLTQNFDKIYDTYAQNTTQNQIRIKCHNDPDVADFLRGGHSVIVKAHGTIDVPAEMIFTRKEYAAARHTHQSFYSMLDALAVTHTFLFIGCGVADPDVRILLEKVAFFYKGSRPHYMCVPKSSHGPHDDLLASYRENLAIKALKYDPKNGHSLLAEAVEELAGLVEERRQMMAQTLTW